MQSLFAHSRGEASASQAILVVVVALAGIGGFTAFGNSADRAIAGDVHSTPPVAPQAATAAQAAGDVPVATEETNVDVHPDKGSTAREYGGSRGEIRGSSERDHDSGGGGWLHGLGGIVRSAGHIWRSAVRFPLEHAGDIPIIGGVAQRVVDFTENVGINPLAALANPVAGFKAGFHRVVGAFDFAKGTVISSVQLGLKANELFNPMSPFFMRDLHEHSLGSAIGRRLGVVSQGAQNLTNAVVLTARAPFSADARRQIASSAIFQGTADHLTGCFGESGASSQERCGALMLDVGANMLTAGAAKSRIFLEVAPRGVAGDLVESAARVPISSEMAAVSTRYATSAFAVESVEEIVERAGSLGRTAMNYGSASADQFLAQTGGLSARAEVAARNGLEFVTYRSAEPFTLDGLVGVGGEVSLWRAIDQHVGYVSGVMERAFPSLDREAAEAALTQHLRNIGSGATEESMTALADAIGGGAEVRAFVMNSDNGWMFGEYGFGALDVALNLPGAYAGRATVNFAQALTGSESEAMALLDRVFSMSDEELAALLANPHGPEGAVAQYAARASQAGWLSSKLGQGVIEAGAGKAKALTRWSNDLMVDFDTLAQTKGWDEIVKDLDQTRAYLKHLGGR